MYKQGTIQATVDEKAFNNKHHKVHFQIPPDPSVISCKFMK